MCIFGSRSRHLPEEAMIHAPSIRVDQGETAMKITVYRSKGTSYKDNTFYGIFVRIRTSASTRDHDDEVPRAASLNSTDSDSAKNVENTEA